MNLRSNARALQRGSISSYEARLAKSTNCVIGQTIPHEKKGWIILGWSRELRALGAMGHDRVNLSL